MEQKYKVIASDGREYGPVDSQTIACWFLERRVNKETMVFDCERDLWEPLALAFNMRDWGPQKQDPQIPQPMNKILDTKGEQENYRALLEQRPEEQGALPARSPEAERYLEMLRSDKRRTRRQTVAKQPVERSFHTDGGSLPTIHGAPPPRWKRLTVAVLKTLFAITAPVVIPIVVHIVLAEFSIWAGEFWYGIFTDVFIWVIIGLTGLLCIFGIRNFWRGPRDKIARDGFLASLFYIGIGVWLLYAYFSGSLTIVDR
jgi:hypothetical protein